MLFNEDDKSNLIYLNKIADSINKYSDFIILSKVGTIKLNSAVGDVNNFLYLLKESILFIDNFFAKSDNKNNYENIEEAIIYLQSNLEAHFGLFGTSEDNKSVADVNAEQAVAVYLSYIVNFFKKIIEFEEELTDVDDIKFLKFLAKTRRISSFLSGEVKYLVDDLNEKIRSLDNKITVGGFKEVYKKDIASFLEKESVLFDKKTSNLLQNFRKDINTIQYDYENELKTKVHEMRISIDETNLNIKDTIKDYEDIKKIINLKGEQLVTDHYSDKAKEEKIVYWGATLATIGIIFFSIFLAMSSLKEYRESTDIPVNSLLETYTIQTVDRVEQIYNIAQRNALIYLILRLIISILIFSSIIYTSRVAYRAYIHMRHSENMMLKLATLRPFINQLNEEDRNQIHKDLVPDFFGKDAGMIDTTNEKFKDLPTNVSALAAKAIEQISVNGSNSSIGKNTKNPTNGSE